MLRIVLSAAVLFGLVLQPAHSQQWSQVQQEVWENVEAYWRLNANEDLEGFLSYLHEDFSGWTHSQDLPRDKEDMAMYLPLGFETTETLIYDVDPVGIKVYGEIAIVHYYYSKTYVDSSGTLKKDTGQWTDILLKQGDRWVMIADHGGSDGGD